MQQPVQQVQAPRIGSAVATSFRSRSSTLSSKASRRYEQNRTDESIDEVLGITLTAGSSSQAPAHQTIQLPPSSQPIQAFDHGKVASKPQNKEGKVKDGRRAKDGKPRKGAKRAKTG